MVREPDKWNGFKTHAGHSFGIASTSSLNKVRDFYGSLPCSDSLNYQDQQIVQIDFSNSFIQVGLKIYDIREDYRVQFAQTRKDDEDIWRLFWWNDTDLIVPAIILLDKPHSFWVSFDGPFHKKTNLEIYEQL